jgi:RimJ/RimL family protein N-acetyltransferase
VQKELLVADTEPGNIPSERVLAKAGFQRGDLIKGAFEVTDLVTGELVKKDATLWHFDRPKQ